MQRYLAARFGANFLRRAVLAQSGLLCLLCRDLLLGGWFLARVYD